MPLTDPVPSSSFDVLQRNAQDTDKFVNQETGTLTNRVGKAIKPIPVIEAEAIDYIKKTNWNPVGLFSGGVTFEKISDFAIDGDGIQWIYTGTLPFTAVAGTVPSSPTYQAVKVSSLQQLANLTEPSDLAQRHRIKTNVAEIATGVFKDGDLLEVSDRSNEHFNVQSGGTANGSFLLNAGTGKTAILQTQGHTLTASSLGLIGGTDCTTTINVNLPPFLTSNGITEIALDTGDIKVSSVLDFVYGGVLFSKSRLLTTALSSNENMLQGMESIRTEKKQFMGNFNIGQIYNNAIKTCVTAKKEFRVVLMGDSIFVGSDYDSQSIPSGYINPTGVDNVDRANAFSFQIFQMLMASLPKDVRLKFYSRSIGGRGYTALDLAWDSIGGLFTGREQATAGKSWRDCVIDLKPDLVIHGLGMNETPDTYIYGLKNYWVDYLVSLQKVGTFDQCIITTPNPNFYDAEESGDFRQYFLNAAKHFVASNQRFAARKYGYSLVDVALLSDIKRYGFDPRQCTYTKSADTLTFRDGSVTKVILPNTGTAANEFTPTNLPIYHSTTFTINPSVNSNAAGFDFKLVCGSAIVQFTGGELIIFAAIYTSSLGPILSGKPYLLTAGTNYTFTATINPTGFYLYDGSNALVLHIADAPYESTLPMRFENGASSANVTVVSGQVRSSQFARYSADTLSNGEMYGNIDYTLNEFGGGINHPSSVGIVEVYNPPFREFASEMLRANLPQSGIIGGTGVDEAVFVGRIAAIEYSLITFKEYFSGIDLEIQVRVSGGVASATVRKNTTVAGVTIYLDTSDMSLFIKNTSIALLQFDYSGKWLSQTPVKLGNVTPRGSVVAYI